ncbi:inositol oxygenase isoform X2 [Boleophthalmus pectinirostris]|uniref:inositol oxygenase isoform X2 n=1 Tax=Boleophthalmus pectinirostris TaxID=150288 RepID=UPI000A1C5509|nr:inositol oxygenase isoform X2 [Boleophthalmus pectinirostris]
MRIVSLGPDPSLVYRPNLEEKKKEEYRNYEHGDLIDRVFNTYKLMHTNQTLTFVQQKHIEWTSFTHSKMRMMEAIMSLDQLVDESDPDVDFPNSFHAFQTAEGIRREHPDKDWFQLVGLIHDVGKIMALWDEPQWAVVGDTFPVGCKFQNNIVFRDTSFKQNPDEINPKYSTECGIYEPNCGLDKVLMSWGHDEYLYRVLKFNNCSIPEEGLYMIRFHSFYPWHSHGDYFHLCSDKDLQMLPWVKEFNKFDLYTKTTDLPDVEKLKPYYQSLIDKYCPGILKW